MARSGYPATATEISATLAQAQPDDIPALLARYADDPRAQVRKALQTASRRLAREQAERGRVRAMYELMGTLAQGGVALGLDEVGRGAVAGPLTVCAVALPQEPPIWGINDSKQLTPARRAELAARIRQQASAIGICHVTPERIDRQGMALSLREAMLGAIKDSGVDPDVVLIDGNPLHVHPRERCIVKGDAKVASIAAASIVAKVTRDEIMVELASQYPGYGFAESKGYASREHIAAIRELGLTAAHRASFCQNFLEQPRLF